MVDKFEKRSHCLYCEKEMDAAYRNKRFCSDKCRVYWNRENPKVQIKNLNEATNEKKPPSQKKTNYSIPDEFGQAGTNIERHPLWKFGDPKENSAGFYMKYNCNNYTELEQLNQK